MAQISEPLGLFAGSDVGSTKCVACCGLHGGKAGSKLNANFFLVGMLVAVILARLAPSLAKSHGLLHVDTFRVSAARFTTAKMEVWAERGHYVPLVVEVALGWCIDAWVDLGFDVYGRSPEVRSRDGAWAALR